MGFKEVAAGFPFGLGVRLNICPMQVPFDRIGK
jgi:hypothetical protein